MQLAGRCQEVIIRSMRMYRVNREAAKGSEVKSKNLTNLRESDVTADILEV